MSKGQLDMEFYVIKVPRNVINMLRVISKWLKRILLTALILPLPYIFLLFILYIYSGNFFGFLEHLEAIRRCPFGCPLDAGRGLSSVLTFASGNYRTLIFSPESIKDVPYFDKYKVIELNEWQTVGGEDLPLYGREIPSKRISFEKKNVAPIFLNEMLLYEEQKFKKLLDILKKPCYHLPAKNELEERLERNRDSANKIKKNSLEYYLLKQRKALECDTGKSKQYNKVRISVVPNNPDEVWATELFVIELARKD